MIKQLATHIAYKNKWMKVREDQIEFKDGVMSYQIEFLRQKATDHEQHISVQKEQR